MGRSHSNAYRQVAPFFPDVALTPELTAVCGRDAAAVQEFAAQFGWNSYETDWKKLVSRDDIGLIDVSTPGESHAEISIAAAESRKQV
jgi:predicted dehydrogenase